MSAPRVDFYVLASSDGPARLRFACRLVEKAWLKQHRVRVQLDPGGELETFDDMLWTWSDGSFVPHLRLGDEDAAPPPVPAPVVLADVADAGPADGDLIVNLSTSLPQGFERFQRIAEVVDADAVRRQRGRERFRQYRERGIQPETHDMKEGA